MNPAPTAHREPPVAVDLSDGESFRAGFPHDHFTWLRANDPVHWHAPTARTPDGEGFWVVSRHADVMAVLRDPVTFSSDRGGGLRERGGTGIKDERSAGTMPCRERAARPSWTRVRRGSGAVFVISGRS